MARRIRSGRTTVLLLLSVPFFLAIMVLAGARLNMTESLPLGLYWRVDRPVGRDVYIRFCPPPTAVFVEARQRGYLHGGTCPGSYRALTKRVSGVPGDVVTQHAEGIRVNGLLLPGSAAMAVDAAGRAMPQIQPRYVLAASQLWVMSDTNPKSFDSRYFGPIDKRWVVDVVVPVLTWGYGGTLAPAQAR